MLKPILAVPRLTRSKTDMSHSIPDTGHSEAPELLNNGIQIEVKERIQFLVKKKDSLFSS